MGFGQRLLSSPPTTKVIMASNFMGFLLHTIGFFAVYWLHLDTVGRQGLWYYCQKNSTAIFECCATMDDFLDSSNSSLPAFIHATRAFETVGFVCVFIANITFYAPLFKPSLIEKRGFAVFLKAIHFITGLNIAIGVTIYGADYKNHSFTSQHNLHASFGLCIAASCMFIISGCILFCADLTDDDD